MSLDFKTIFIEHSKIVDCSNLKDEKLIDFVRLNGKTIKDYNHADIASKKHVAVIGGGMSSEREVSYMSSNGIVRSILELGHKVTFIDMGSDVSYVLSKIKPDVVFNALHGTYGEDGSLPGLLNIMRIPYTGCGVLASSVAFNKKKSREIFRANNIEVAGGMIVKKSDNLKSDPMPRPYVIKPLCEGSSIGVILVFAEDDFSFADYDFPHGDEVLIEQYIKGREMQVAVLNGEAIGALEIKFLKNKRFYDYETKYTEGFAQHLLPAPLPENLYKKLLKKAEEASQVFDASGMVRVEFIYSEKDDIFYILEVNTHPGMTPLSICPEIVTLRNMSYTDLVKQILDEAKFEE